MNSVARIFVAVGVIFIIIGGLIYLLGRFNITIGRLPGDFSFQRGKLTVYLPCGTSILLSIVLTVILALLSRFFKK